MYHITPRLGFLGLASLIGQIRPWLFLATNGSLTSCSNLIVSGATNNKYDATLPARATTIYYLLSTAGGINIVPRCRVEHSIVQRFWWRSSRHFLPCLYGIRPPIIDPFCALQHSKRQNAPSRRHFTCLEVCCYGTDLRPWQGISRGLDWCELTSLTSRGWCGLIVLWHNVHLTEIHHDTAWHVTALEWSGEIVVDVTLLLTSLLLSTTPTQSPAKMISQAGWERRMLESPGSLAAWLWFVLYYSGEVQGSQFSTSSQSYQTMHWKEWRLKNIKSPSHHHHHHYRSMYDPAVFGNFNDKNGMK